MEARLSRETLSHRINFPPPPSLLTKNPIVNGIRSPCSPYRALRATRLKPQSPGTPAHPFFLIFPFPPPVFSPLLSMTNITCLAQWSYSFLLNQELNFIQTYMLAQTLTCTQKNNSKTDFSTESLEGQEAGTNDALYPNISPKLSSRKRTMGMTKNKKSNVYFVYQNIDKYDCY